MYHRAATPRALYDLLHYGWHLTPLHGPRANVDKPGKKPLFKDFSVKASNVPEIVSRWFEQHPGCNLGAVLKRSGLVAIDIDSRNGDPIKQAAWLAEHALTIDVSCLVALSGRGDGGRHLYFQMPAGRTLKLPVVREAKALGIDVLGGADTHFTVIPPSIHADTGRAYTWLDEYDDPGFIGTLPESLLEGTEEAPPDTSAAKYEGDVFATDGLANTVPETDEQVARVQDALAHVSADCDRDTWRDVCAAIRSTGCTCAEDLAREWSATAPTRFNERAFSDLWQSLHETARHGRSLTIATLFYRAQEAGWTDPRKQDRALENYGDTANSIRFANEYREKLICVAGQWHAWQDGIWLPHEHVTMKAAKTLAEACVRHEHAALLEARKTGEETAAKAAERRHKDALVLHGSEKRLAAMVSLAKSEPGMWLESPSALDADPWLFGVANGVIDLRTGNLLAADPDMLISKRSAASFDRGATCEGWLSFLDQVFCGDEELIRFVQRFAGYCLTGDMSEHMVLFCYGAGANGKSTLANVLMALVGSYGQTLDSAELVKGAKTDTNGRTLAQLPGKRLALANEIAAGQIWNDQLLKRLASGDELTGKLLYHNAFTYRPSAKLIVMTNHLPGSHDASEGFWRRVALLRFARQFAQAERIPNLDAKLINEELNGILQWALEGCRAWRHGGLRVPTQVRRATSEYREESDALGLWLSERCEIGPSLEHPAGQLYGDWRSWCSDQGISAGSAISFGRALATRGFGKRRTNGNSVWQGLRVIAADPFEGL